MFSHSSGLTCVTFSVDGKYILSGGEDKMISEWAVPQGIHPKILAITTARDSCIDGDLSTAEELLTQEIDIDVNNHISYANRSFVMSRKQDWDRALEDANKSISIQPSLTGYISKGIALCGNGDIQDARASFDVAFMYTDQDSEIVHFLLLIKAIALFNANQNDEANLLLKELTNGCPNADTRACHIVAAYLRVQLGMKAFDGARHDEAIDHFTAALSSSNLSSKSDIHEIYEDLVALFGWDLKSLWLTVHQKRCQAFLSAHKVDEALESHKSMMDDIDETTKASCLDWSTEFQKECNALAASDDRILGAEIPGQDQYQYGYDAEPDFFRGMHGHPQISRPRPQQRPGRFKKLKLAMTKSPRSDPPPAPAPPTTRPSPAAPATFKTQLRHLFTRQSDHATPPVVDVAFAQAKERNAAAGAPQPDNDLILDEYSDDYQQDPDTQHHQSTVAQLDTGEHGGGKSCFCF
jgi:tetratricopeptide (TPR) repeat protein